ncbi:MAG TPA: NAD(P)/FAD-dependent oxidoreductase [Candidatus Binatia bacterium]|nr:NAD(P)/FAD-dependent oxidoreductase [Candidatus Binatia bacterium]
MTQTETATVVIIGGGVVGCAVAMELSGRYEDVFLLEEMPQLGMAASSRNSGVIHSGIYYPTGSRKARLCVEGNRLTYEFCEAHGVPHRRTGKVVVAASTGEEPQLEALLHRGQENGVAGLRIIDGQELRAREPHVEGRAALEVPSAGLVVSEELVKAYARVARDRGANLLTHAKVSALEPAGRALRVTSERGTIDARAVVNCAGLFADEVAALTGETRHRIQPVRGDYCEVAPAKAHLVHSLVYPLPDPRGMSLGLHLTKTLWGTLLVGPTAQVVSSKTDYESGRVPVAVFARDVRRLLPELEEEDLRPAYSGIRAKLASAIPQQGEQTKEISDFVIERDPRLPGIIHLIGIESPGLTSAYALAREVTAMVRETLS